jgi:hypothetical protein
MACQLASLQKPKVMQQQLPQAFGMAFHGGGLVMASFWLVFSRLMIRPWRGAPAGQHYQYPAAKV